MKTTDSPPVAFALVGVLALTLYVLGCTSFSPDDKRVLFPSFDLPSGKLAVSVYDRDSGRVEPVFVPRFYADLEGDDAEPRLLRPQWLPDGSGILVAWPGGDDAGENGLNVAVLPLKGQGPTRVHFLPEFEGGLAALLMPLAVSGSRLFVATESEQIVRLDLVTGAIVTHEAESAWQLTGEPTGKRVLFVRESEETPDCYEMGEIDQETFAPKVLARHDLPGEGELGLFVFGADGKRVAYVRKDEAKQELTVLREGKVELTPMIEEAGESLHFGHAVFSPGGEVLYLSYLRTAEGATNASLGFLEITLPSGQLRRTTLFSASADLDQEFAAYLQLSLSHDGRTLATASTYFALEREETGLKPDHCALYLVDLTDPQRAIKKVPIPLPPDPDEAK